MRTLCLPLLFFLAAAVTAVVADTVIEEIIARINNEIITRSDLGRSREQLLAELRQQHGQEAEQRFAAREKDLLRDLVDQQLLLEKGKDLGITGDTETIKRLDELRKQMNLESMEDLEKAAQQQGVSFEDFKQNVRNNIITQMVISREVGSRITLTQEELQKFYEEHKAELSTPEQVRLSEIMVSTEKAEDDPAALAAAEQKAQQLLEQIRNGANFEEVAKQSSDASTGLQGGDLGYFKRGMLARQLEEKAFAMKVGEVSDVIRTRQGFLILKVTEHQEAGVPPLKQVEPRIQEAIYLQKLQPALRAYLTKLREEAYIDIKQGFVDTGASPNQTKPVFTTAAQQAEKEQEKKKKKKFLLF